MAHAASDHDLVFHSPRAYDLLVRVLTLGRERRFRERIVELARLEPGESALDVGCGTGALALSAKARVGPTGRVGGIDPSPEMVARARAKAAKARVEVGFETATIEALPFDDASFDVVLSSLMLHHVTEEGRRQGIGEIARVLRPGGRCLAVDLGGGHGGKRHGRFHRIANHGDFDLDQLTPALEAAGLEVVEGGPLGGPRIVGLPNLRFILARLPPP